MKQTSNIGLIGIDSIRIGGMKVADLPIAEQANARNQMPLSIDTERKNKIKNILAGSPTHRSDYLKSRITECRSNIVRMKGLKSNNSMKINEYRTAISMCKFRDEQIDALDADNPNYKKITRDLFKRFPPYQIDKMNQQIDQFEFSNDRADEVIQNENDSIAELTGILALCEERDKKLKSLGSRIEAG